MSEPQKLSKIDVKRMQIYQQRRERHIAAGVPPDKVDETIAREDYERLPPDGKIRRIETAFANYSRAVAKEMKDLEHNDTILADSMDVNFRAIAKMLVALGMPLEKQREFLELAKEEMKAELAAREAARNTRIAQPGDMSGTLTQSGEAPPPPEEATVFGG